MPRTAGRLVPLALVAFTMSLLVGCTGWVSGPDPLAGWSPLGERPASLDGYAIADLEVDSRTGELVVLAYGYGADGSNRLDLLVLGRDFVVHSVTPVNAPMEGPPSVRAPRDGSALLSDGQTNFLIDLTSGAVAVVSGMDAQGNYPPAFVTGGDLDTGSGGGGETFSVPCEIENPNGDPGSPGAPGLPGDPSDPGGPGGGFNDPGGSDPCNGGDLCTPMDVYEGDGEAVVLVRSIPLWSSGITGVDDITYAGVRNTVFALSYEGPIGLDADTGAPSYFFDVDFDISSVATWAYDVVSDAIVIVDADGTFRLYQL